MNALQNVYQGSVQARMSLIWLMLEPLEFVKNVENSNTLGVLGPKMKRKERLLTVDSVTFDLEVYSKVLFLL